MNNFEALGLPETMLPALEAINFTIPTPIQAQAIPVAMEGHDILGSAQTGTGKTGAFAIPMIAHLLACPASSALILLPTRELARQVLDAADKMLGNRQKILSALLIGGDSMIKQLQQLKKKPRIIVGTPGRINDHLRQRTLKLDETDFLVLDETDRMLDMGFGAQLEQIAKYLPAARQTLMFSATLPANIISLSRKYLNNPVRIAVGATTAPAANIRQELIKTTDAAKYGELINQLQNREGSVLVFVKTKYGAERLAQKLAKENQAADAIHGDLRQSRREKVIAGFRQRKFRVLVATDIAARGLDIPHIESVINYDLPQCPEDYIHRIGRTARAGAAGTAVNLLTPKDASRWKEIYDANCDKIRNKNLLYAGMKLTIPGSVRVTEDGKAVDAQTDSYIKSIQAIYQESLKTVLGHTDVNLTDKNPQTGERAVRNAETNLGDLTADAYRYELGAEIGLSNGGGIRSFIAAGNITYENTLAVFPYGNMACLIEVTGQQLKDALEMASKNYPQESGGFLQVSGVTYTIDSSVPSSVKLDDKGNFLGVSGAYRVTDIAVNGEPLDLNRTYTLASHNYMLKSAGDGMTMFKGAKILKDEVMTDVDVLSDYINTHLGGNVGAEYANPAGQGRITFK